MNYRLGPNIKKAIAVILSGVILIMLGIVFYILEYSICMVIRYYILAIASVVLAVIDYREKIIPNKILLWLIAARSIVLIVELVIAGDAAWSFLIDNMLGLVIGGGILLICRLVSRGGIGMGDIKYFAVIGYYVGFSKVMLFLFAAIAASFFVSIILLLMKKTTLKAEVPMAPSITIGILVCLLIGV